MSSEGPNKRQKQSVDAMVVNTSGLKCMVLEFALPFLPLDDLFPNVSLVSKGIHQQCLAFLVRHCQEHHPILLVLNERNNKARPNSHWLTYGRYRSFLASAVPPPRYFVGDEPIPSRPLFPEYELVLEITNLPEDESKVFAYDISPVDLYWSAQFHFKKLKTFPHQLNFTRDLPELRVRVLMHRKSTGELTTIMDRTVPLGQSFLEEGELCEVNTPFNSPIESATLKFSFRRLLEGAYAGFGWPPGQAFGWRKGGHDGDAIYCNFLWDEYPAEVSNGDEFILNTINGWKWF
jgi:hypothetical protein